MPSTVVTPFKHPSQSIFLTFEALQELGLEPGDLVSVKAGSASTNVKIAPHPEKNLISYQVLDSLGLPYLERLTILLTGSKTIAVGPVIGIMVTRSKKRTLAPFTSQNNLLRGFLNYALESNYAGFIFYPEDVDMQHGQISGFYLAAGPEGSPVWKKHVFPLPDAVYDRVLFRSLERKKLTREVTAFLIRNQTAYFNPKFLSKWETYQILYTNPKLHANLPETKRYDSPESLLEFLETYQTVYLKPINGSLGKDIIRLSHTSEGYRYQYRKKKRSLSGVWHSPHELAAELPKLIKAKNYIMQRGLELIKYNGQVFDIRVLMQKNGRGQWVNTATVARVARSGSIFPNIAAGGTARNIETLWRDLASENWASSQTYQSTIQTSMEAVASLEGSLGTFGEAGLDIGIDASGHIWIIEINSKPSRKVFPPDQADLKEMSIKLPIDYAAHLAGYMPDQRWETH